MLGPGCNPDVGSMHHLAAGMAQGTEHIPSQLERQLFRACKVSRMIILKAKD